ncbi:hypothetical protein PsAD46_02093 [Pseudovibrio sp. Ad46]|uniref:hypothetical protein n=1 Tax=unclassified Pseudovibrio TaxID=2627060 RepID=UPI0007AEBF86|nr:MULTISPECIES: hypothetical protein [unclassified Pseudovibrio]KZK90472.1 hypothetical protein PsAD46_02093 [Pseudovibrio sp. Ad46]KZK92806.1 hypothetical protein PsAD5_03527 [Pseudovibrio sp. Ad5]KZK98778.1 hypothetical protein PsW74_03367 [Pseudovibrio sp. W74]KZL09271.1 hypothetical protein PsAD14_02332 [Pseudovibrio sp. Ad14]KZL26462.1 hypothetical protein PsAD37_01901 [Pseudovibrio sp. Ad37]
MSELNIIREDETSFHQELEGLQLASCQLKNLVEALNIVLTSRLEHTREYDMLLTINHAIMGHNEDLQDRSLRVLALLQHSGDPTYVD